MRSSENVCNVGHRAWGMGHGAEEHGALGRRPYLTKIEKGYNYRWINCRDTALPCSDST